CGNDDLEYSWRLQLHGRRLLIATDVFVHHVGQVSFSTVADDERDRLDRESGEALARKLQAHYAPGDVPSAEDLWGISWFRAGRRAARRRSRCRQRWRPAWRRRARR